MLDSCGNVDNTINAYSRIFMFANAHGSCQYIHITSSPCLFRWAGPIICSVEQSSSLFQTCSVLGFLIWKKLRRNPLYDITWQSRKKSACEISSQIKDYEAYMKISHWSLIWALSSKYTNLRKIVLNTLFCIVKFLKSINKKIYVST